MLLLDSLNLTPLIQQPSPPVEKEEMRSIAREQNGEVVLPGSRSLGCPVASLPNHRAKTRVGVPQGEHDGGRVREPATQVPGAGAFHRLDRKPGLYYGAWRRLARPKVIPGEFPMYVRRISHDSLRRLLRSDNRFGLCNWAFSAPLVARRACRRELRIEGRLGNKPDGIGAVARRSSVGSRAVPCGSRKTLSA